MLCCVLMALLFASAFLLIWKSYSLTSLKMQRLHQRKLEEKMLGICEATAPEVKKAQPVKIDQIKNDNYCLKCPYRNNIRICEECEFCEV